MWGTSKFWGSAPTMTEIGVDMVRADSLMCCNNPSLLMPLQMQYTAPAIIVSVPSKPAVPAPVMEYISPSLAVSYARVVYTQSCACHELCFSSIYSACCTGACRRGHLSPAPGVSDAVPAPVVEYISPAPFVSYASPSPAVYAASAPLVKYISQAPAVSHAAPAPVVDHISPSPAVCVCASQAPVVEHVLRQRRASPSQLLQCLLHQLQFWRTPLRRQR